MIIFVLYSTCVIISNLWDIDLLATNTLDHISVKMIYHYHSAKSLKNLAACILCAPIINTVKCIIFYHGTIYSLVVSTLLIAFEAGYLILCLEITSNLTHIYPSELAMTIKGHLDQKWYNTGITVLILSSTLTPGLTHMAIPSPFLPHYINPCHKYIMCHHCMPSLHVPDESRLDQIYH